MTYRMMWSKSKTNVKERQNCEIRLAGSFRLVHFLLTLDRFHLRKYIEWAMEMGMSNFTRWLRAMWKYGQFGAMMAYEVILGKSSTKWYIRRENAFFYLTLSFVSLILH